MMILKRFLKVNKIRSKKVWVSNFFYFLYKLIKENIFFKVNIVVGKTTSVEKLLSFFAKTRPMNVGCPLIRIGGNNDGGYLVPDDFIGVDGCFSPGVADKADFENELTAKGVKCFLADFSVKSPPLTNPLFDFEPLYLGPDSDNIYITLTDWVNCKSPHSKDLILQMDIEGAEYAVLAETDYSILEKFRIIIIEFHNFDSLITGKNFELINVVFAKLMKKFVVVHIHPNNFADTAKYKGLVIPSAVEYTFIRRDRIKTLLPITEFPNALDQPCSKTLPDITLPDCFYKN